MDSPPECVLALSSDPPPSPPTLPSLDQSPRASPPWASPPRTRTSPPRTSPPLTRPPPPSSSLELPLNSPEASPRSSDTTPYFPLSPFAVDQDQDQDLHDEGAEEEDQGGDEDGVEGVPQSPTPAVALFPGSGGPETGCSPPATPLAPLPGFGALELALSSGQSGGCGDELDLQLFQKDSLGGGLPAVGGASSGPALRFPCHVCGKRFRFQSILSLHARAHSLDRDRRATALYRARLPPTHQHLKVQQNHKDLTQNHHHPRSQQNQRPLPGSLTQHLGDEEDPDGEQLKGPDDGLLPDKNQNFLLSESLTPPLTDDPVSLMLPYNSSAPPEGEVAPAPSASTFRCHACKGKFRTASELARHVRILHNPYKCTLCPFSASQEERLAAHLQECHPSPQSTAVPPAYGSRPVLASPDTPVPTPTPTPTPSMPQMVAATAVAGSVTLPAFRCDTCGQRFTQSWFLKGHMRKHKDSLDHKCQVCGRGFKEPWFLKNHMKVHLNKLGLKAGLGGLGVPVGAEQQAKSNQSLNALYSSLLLAQRGGGGGGGKGGRGRTERDCGSRGGLGSNKSAILGYLGLPGEGVGASCMERLQAVAQVAEMGNNSGGSSGSRDPGRGAGGRGGGSGQMAVSDGGEQVAMWQLVARSLLAAQQQQQQQQRSQQQGQRGPARSSVTGEADQVRAYLGGLDPRQEALSIAPGDSGGPWECPDCGKLFRSLQQVVVHARVHSQRPQKGGAGGEEGSASVRGGRVSGEVHLEAKLQSAGKQAEAAGLNSVISSLHGENGLVAGSATLGSSRERVRGSGVKDCPYCGKAFRSSHHLKVHLRVHTGERPYKCPHCDYAGTQSGSLKYHLQRHHREQRNAQSTSSSTSSSSSSTSLGSSLHSLGSGATARGDALAKQRRSPGHAPGSDGPTESSSSRYRQQPWVLGLLNEREHQKALTALREVDLETQYRYLSGVMGALYQGGMVDGGWIRESPPPKTPKVSRRKPLTTSRMVHPSNGSDKDASGSSTQGRGFEPLDLSRRPSPSPGGMEEDGMPGCVDGGGAISGEDTLNQCLFCPFRTSSTELMAMHLQVNHTSKSRRKRGSLAALEEGRPPKPPQPRVDHPDPDPMAIWRYVSQAEDQELMAEWASTRNQIHNGFSEDLSEPLESMLYHQASARARSFTEDPACEENLKGDEEEEQEEEVEEELGAAEETSSPGDSPGPEQSPSLGSESRIRDDEGVLENYV